MRDASLKIDLTVSTSNTTRAQNYIMRLKGLFTEDDNQDRSSEVIEVLKNIIWSVNVCGRTVAAGNTGDLQELIEVLKQAKFPKIGTPISDTYGQYKVHIIMSATISRSYTNSEHFETLHQIFHPDLDIPKPVSDPVFHDEDDFDNDEFDLDGYEFTADTDETSQEPTYLTADIADTRESVELPPLVSQWMMEYAHKMTDIINSLYDPSN